MHRVTAALLVLAATGACVKEPKPPPPPPPPLCARVERGAGEVIEEVRCSGKDLDEDGVDDAVDLCPDLAEVPNGLEDKDGCPDPDGDQDGFADFEDACPKETGVPPDGCPLLDRDGDQVADHLDACPSQPEDLDRDRDDDGCPDGAPLAPVRAREDQLWQAARLEVRPGRAAVTKAGQEALEALVDAVLTRVDEVVRVRVAAYASLREAPRGRARSLAERRLALVRAALTEAGVKEQALEQVTYPLGRGGERVGRVDVMVFLHLAAAAQREDRAPEADWDAALLPYPEPEASGGEDWDL